MIPTNMKIICLNEETTNEYNTIFLTPNKGIQSIQTPIDIPQEFDIQPKNRSIHNFMKQTTKNYPVVFLHEISPSILLTSPHWYVFLRSIYLDIGCQCLSLHENDFIIGESAFQLETIGSIYGRFFLTSDKENAIKKLSDRSEDQEMHPHPWAEYLADCILSLITETNNKTNANANENPIEMLQDTPLYFALLRCKNDRLYSYF